MPCRIAKGSEIRKIAQRLRHKTNPEPWKGEGKLIILHCESIPNLRDLGNTVTADGRRIRKDCLLRSAHLGNASEEDIRYLQREHRLRTVIDLRTGGEREEEPDRAGSCLVLNIPIIESFEAGITHESTTENMPFPDLATLYRKIVQDKGCQMGFRKVLRACFENDYESGSVLWHCSEGKDRCGLTAALLLEALGVEKDKIMEDYLETNTTNIPKAEKIRDREMQQSGDAVRAQCLYQAYVVDERYLKNAWDAMGDHYLTRCLGFSDEDLQRFRDKVLE